MKALEIEFKAHVLGMINDGAINEDNIDDWHNVAFNEGYYIIGYYNAKEWLKSYDIDAFEAIEYVMEQEEMLFGEVQLKPEDMNAERIVNLYVYFKSGDLIEHWTSLEELKDACEE